MTTDTIRLPHRLRALATTALMLETLERTPRGASADQYRALVRQLHALLDEAGDDPALLPLIERLPALAELHENRHFAHAGLCRAPLDLMVRSERQTQALLSRL
jgi:hypothetical protein